MHRDTTIHQRSPDRPLLHAEGRSQPNAALRGPELLKGLRPHLDRGPDEDGAADPLEPALRRNG